MKICLSISTQVRQPHFLRRPQRWWLPLHRSSSWHSDHRAYQEGYPKSFKVTCVGGTDYRTLSYHVRSAPPTFHYHITLGLPLLRSRRASFCFVAQCSSLRPPHPVTQKKCQSHHSHGPQLQNVPMAYQARPQSQLTPQRVQLNR